MRADGVMAAVRTDAPTQAVRAMLRTRSQPVSRHEPFAFASVSSDDQTPGSIRTM